MEGGGKGGSQKRDEAESGIGRAELEKWGGGGGRCWSEKRL